MQPGGDPLGEPAGPLRRLGMRPVWESDYVIQEGMPAATGFDVHRAGVGAE